MGFEPTVPLRAHTISSRAQSSTLATLRSEPTGEGSPAVRSWRCHKYVAERVGFEPTMELPPYRFSKTGAFVRSAISPGRLRENYSTETIEGLPP